ncbi:PREDICTED: thyroid adenoma-associated protein homolog [Ceratosolen solmsi marchali]|uniref:Thyroid adenoma-associated protein homolog n=1 Tax=Ceratosolen solmsi marchali TaxID=326594 RepID=A0AAJ7DWU5_9HYME|nr:PREDICTED: thyroid adenoma-associated protein homolog [Ceratosolen solmsi marchali]
MSEMKFRWYNDQDYKHLEYSLTCSSEEIRLDTLKLIAISKKSTLTFTEQELNLITTFLKYNLREKIEFVPLIKKILKRLNDSYAVLKRQLDKENKLKELKNLHPEFSNSLEDSFDVQAYMKSYQIFIIFVHEICLNSLYPGAINVHKKSSLQILCLIDEFLSKDLQSFLWDLHQFKKLLDCLLLDTYEVNKDMAFRLIKSCKLTESFFDTKIKVLELINVAIQMGNSVRPLDSVTAAYMFKISMLSSNIQEILLELIKFKKKNCIEEENVFYMIMLLKLCLETPVKLAVENIVIAVSKHSLYGYIFCIHSILSTVNLRNIINDENWKTLLSDLVNICFKLNTAVSQIVNNSSPEGHLPMDLNSHNLDNISKNMESIIITSQMILLCSWRTVKEISLLFGYLTTHVSIYDDTKKTGLLNENQIKEIGNQLVSLLCETKHRGAFEQAYVGFGQLCRRLWHLNETQIFLKQLPIIWLQQLLISIVHLVPENSKLCATRRSAGVPFMMQAIVTSEIKKCNDKKILTFHSIIRILFKLVTVEDNYNLNDVENLLFQESLFTQYKKLIIIHKANGIETKCTELNKVTEIKTHALNILRALFRHCLLGDLVKDYIAEGFITAFKSYDGKSWAERNAATLLFSSLVIRVFGAQRTKDHINLTLHNKMTGKIFFDRYPILLPFLLNELTIFINQTENYITPKIQSILLILSRLYPSVSSDITDEDWQIDKFIDLVSKCGKSIVYKTRELAARALVPLLTEKNILSILCNLLNVMITKELSLNLLHGYALQLLELVRSQQFSKVELASEKLKNFLNLLNSKILRNLENSNCYPACFPVSTIVLEILIELSKLEQYSWIYKETIFLNILEKIQLHLTNRKILIKNPGIELYEITAVNLLITSLDNDNYTGPLINNQSSASKFWILLLHHNNTEMLSVIWSKLIYIVQKTNSPMLYNLGFMTSVKTLQAPITHSDVQDEVFEFMYKAIIDMEKDVQYTHSTFTTEMEKFLMCIKIFKKLSFQLKMKTFYPRGTFFKLFGKTFGIILKKYNDFKLDFKILKEFKIIIYDTFLNYSDMESNIDCRIGISEVLFDLYINPMKNHDIYFILNWWTILLQLIYDDNIQIRSNAAKIVDKLLPGSKLGCEAIIIEVFFQKFVLTFGENIEAIVAAFFCWCMSTSAVLIEEMDETDVFNKSCNYECFDPLLIKDMCIFHLKQIISKYNLASRTLSNSIKEWIQKQLKLDNTYEFQNLIELIVKYQNMIPNTEKPLKRLLDPTYPAKLIKEISYLDIKQIIISKNVLTILGKIFES